MSSTFPFRDEPAAAWWRRDVVRAGGPDAVSFLQGQLSQDLEAMGSGDASWSFLLEPQGRVEALLRVVRLADDEVILHVDAGFGGAVVERLERFKLRVKADIDLVDWKVLAVRGPAGSVPAPGPQDVAAMAVAPAGHPGLDGYDVIGPAPFVPEGIELADEAAFEAVRIEAGLPALGRDLEVGAIPAESGMVQAAASFTKGCYTGQELVARVDSRGGRAPRQLVGVRLEASGGPTPSPRTALIVDGTEIGLLTTVVGPPTRQSPVGLARVKRSVEVPGDAFVGEDGAVVARLEPLPLVS